MKTNHIITIFYLALCYIVKAEVNPVSISEPYSVKNKDESIQQFGKGYLGINHNYNYDDWGMAIQLKPTELTLYDSTLHVVKKLKLAKIARWNQRFEISKDAATIFVIYQPTRWNRSVANGTVKLCILDQHLTCTRICKFIIPGSRPGIDNIEKISSSHLIIEGNFINRGNHFLLNVDMNTGKFTKFKLLKSHDYYFAKHFSQDNKTIILSRHYDSSTDSLRFSTYTNSGTLLKRQWIVINEDYSLQDIDLIRTGKNKYVFYGHGYNKNLGVGHENYLCIMVYENGKINKTVVVDESKLDFAARNDFSKVGLTAENESKRKEYETNRKNLREYYHPMFNSLQILSNGNYYMYANIYHSEVQGGVVVEFDKNWNPLNANTFPIIERNTFKTNAYNYSNGKCFVNNNGFYYAYTMEHDVSGIFIDKSGNMKSFAFETKETSSATIAVANHNGFSVYTRLTDPSAEEDQGQTQVVRQIFAE